MRQVRAHIMRNGSAFEVARLQFLSAQCRMAMLPPYNPQKPPDMEQLRPHILPALADALKGFAKLRCHAEVAECLYLRARVWHTAGAADEREADAQAFAKADAEAQRSAVRLPGRLGEYAEAGVLEAHLAQLRELDGAQGA